MITFLANALEGNPGSDLRAMSDRVEKKAVIIVVDAECPITNLSEDVTGEIDTDYALNLPHQIGTDVKTSDFAAHGRVKHFIKVVASTQSEVRIKPVFF